MYSPKGTVYHGHSSTGEVTKWEVGRGPGERTGRSEMHLIPMSGWWVAKWEITKDGLMQICADICTPATSDLDEWSYIDLELDPIWREDGYVDVLDEEDFQSALVLGHIDSEEEERARAASNELLKKFRDAKEPFGEYGWECWNEALKSGLPPIRELMVAQTSCSRIL